MGSEGEREREVRGRKKQKCTHREAVGEKKERGRMEGARAGAFRDK